MNKDQYLESPITPGFTILSVKELLEMEFPDVGWIVKNLIPIPGLTFIAGRAGKGKSLLTLFIAKAVSSGSDFVGHFETKEGGVLIIDEENQPSEIQKRFNLFQIAQESPIYIMSMQGFQITKEQHIKEVLNFAVENDCKLIIFDSLVRLHPLDENQAKEMRLVHAALRPFRDAGLAVIIIHHQGKLGVDQREPGMRGSSELDAMAESVVMVNKKDRILTITQTKLRNGEAVPAFELELVGNGEESLTITYRGLDSANKLNTARKAVLELLESQTTPINQREVCTKLSDLYGVSTDKTQTTLTSLVKSKEIILTKGAHGAKLYSLWQEGS